MGIYRRIGPQFPWITVRTRLFHWSTADRMLPRDTVLEVRVQKPERTVVSVPVLLQKRTESV